MSVSHETFPSVPTAPSTGMPWQPASVRILRYLRNRGFTAGLMPLGSGRVRCNRCGRVLDPASAEVVELHRTEGGSDPGDAQLIAALRWAPEQHLCLGVLVLGYGPTASPADAVVTERMGKLLASR